jgi:hypothetical protein
MFNDPVNPTETEIRAWAATPDATEPMEDWDLILASDARDELYLELAAAPDIPNRRYFLHVLYLIAGDEVRFTERPHEPSTRLRRLLATTESSASSAIERWHKRVTHLLAQPETFSYKAWCGGDLAYERQPNER